MGKLLNQVLNNHYYNIKFPSSFSNIKALYNSVKSEYPNVTLQEVRNWMNKQEVHTIHRIPNLKFKRNPIVSKYIDHNWQIDLIETKSLKNIKKFRYILLVIDNLSKYAWGDLLENKTGLKVKKSFIKILKNSKRKPTILASDAGKEFTNRKFKKFLKWRNIKHLVLKDSTKATVVERLNQTIKNKINKFMYYYKTKNFKRVFNTILENYNNSIHSRTKYKPIQVNLSNQKHVFNNLYKIKVPQETQFFKNGDNVRVQLIRNVFEKGYKPNFSKEIFTIHKVFNTSPYFKYKVKDKKGTLVRGSFYGKELLKI